MTEQTKAESAAQDQQQQQRRTQQQLEKKKVSQPAQVNNNDASLVNNNLSATVDQPSTTDMSDAGRVSSWLAKNRQFQQQQQQLVVVAAANNEEKVEDVVEAEDEDLADFDSGRPSSVDTAAKSPNNVNNNHIEEAPGRGPIVRGASPVPGDENDVIHQFLIPNKLAGSMVGTRGRNISYIRAKSGASVWMSRNFFDKMTQVVNVRGPVECVRSALQVIRKRFPNMDVKPINTAVPIQRNPALQPTMCQLSLPVGALVDVAVSAMCRGTTLFIQQPTHPSFHHLEKMDATIRRHYCRPPGAGGSGDSPAAVPALPRPVNPGAVCVAPFGDSWYRAIIADVFPEEDAVLMKYLDWGGYERMSVACLRQIRTEMMHLPFQAVEAHLAYVSPLVRPDEDVDQQLERLSRTVHQRYLGNGRRLKCQVMYFNDVGQPCVYLYARDQQGSNSSSSSNEWRFVQEELVAAGLMQWFQMPRAAPQLPTMQHQQHQQQQQQQQQQGGVSNK